MTEFRVPESQKAGLALLASMKGSDAEQLIITLADAPKGLDPTEFTRHLSSGLNLSLDDGRELAKVISSLYMVKINDLMETAELVDAIHEAISISNEENLFPKDGDWDKYKSFLISILDLDDNIGSTIKAFSNLRDHERTYCTAKIYTDVRPTFGLSPEEGFNTASVVHNLLITYHSTSGHGELQIALDSEDLLELKKIVNRAEVKERVIRKNFDSKIDFIL